MGKKRKSGGADPEGSVPAKRTTVETAAQPRQGGAATAAPPKRGAAALAKAGKGSDGVGGAGKPGGEVAPRASIDDMFGQLRAKKRAPVPALPAEAGADADSVRL